MKSLRRRTKPVLVLALAFVGLWGLAGPSAAIGQSCAGPATPHIRLCSVTRSPNNPLITSASSSTIGRNIAGPSVIRVPSWLPNPKGQYYMYFAAHNGSYIRLGYSGSVQGPWKIYTPGTLKVSQVYPFTDTIASPDVHIFDAQATVRMYFHTDHYPGSTQQWSGVSKSTNGINFTLASTKNIAKYYLRVWQWAGRFYGLQKGWNVAPAELGESPDGINPFTPIKTMPNGSIRHMGVLLKSDVLLVFYSRIGDAPERILLSTMKLSGIPAIWSLSTPVEVLRP